MKNLFLPILLVTFAMANQTAGQTAEQLMVQQQFFNQYGKIFQKGIKDPNIVGPRFLFDDWKPMELKTKEFEVVMSAVKLNLFNSTLEVLYEGEEMEMYPYAFDHIILKEGGQSRMFVPAHNYWFDGKALEGFMEVVGSGEEKVLVQHCTAIKEPGPSANIVGGPTDNLLVKTSKVYIFAAGNLVLVKNKKQFVQYFKGSSKKAEKLMKERKTDFKDPYELYEIMESVRG